MSLLRTHLSYHRLRWDSMGNLIEVGLTGDEKRLEYP